MAIIKESKKKEILRDYKETEIHKELKILFENIYTDNTNIYITHGPNEFGRDLIISEKGPLQIKNTSVVVKMDKLSGSAIDKNVQEIRTQVEQCFVEPMIVKDEKDQLVTDYVYICIFGEISKNGNKNLDILLKPFSGRYKIFDITELTNLFSEYYYSVFVGASGYEALSRKFSELDEMLNKKSKLLSQSFIEPNLRSYEKSSQDLLLYSHNTDKKKNVTALGHTLFGKKENLNTLIEKLEKHLSTIYIDGDAGSGKTVFSIKLMQYMLKNLINKSNTKKEKYIKVPVMIKATSLKNSHIKDFEDIIQNYYIDTSFELDIGTLIIDGIDEVAKVDRHLIIEKVKEFSKDRCSLIITSRKNASIKKEMSQFLHYELLEFESSQVINFINKILKGNEILINALVKGIERLKKQIPMYPMSLTLLIEIAKTQKEVPASISELYERYMKLVVGDYNNYDEGIHVLFEPKIKFEFLYTLAYEEYFKNNVSTIKRESFDRFLVEYVNSHSHIKSIDDFLHELSRLTILVIDDEKVDFLHKSFLDYFIAKYFFTEFDNMIPSDYEDIYSLYFSSLWEDVTYFYFGLKNKISKEQIDKILLPSFSNICNSKEPVSISKDNTNLLETLSIFQIGKLLQYAWNTKNEVKNYALSIGVKTAIHLRSNLIVFQDDEVGMELPAIASDAGMLHLIDLFYSSNFLIDEIEKILDFNINVLSSKSKEELLLDNNFQSSMYFSSLYTLVNASNLKEELIGKLIHNISINEEKLQPHISLPIFGLFTIIKKLDKKVNIKQEHILELNLVHKKLIQKYKTLAEDVFNFKNKVDKIKVSRLRN